MGFTGILTLVVLALFVLVLTEIVQAVRAKNWKKTVLIAAAFIAFVWLLYFGLVWFITAM